MAEGGIPGTAVAMAAAGGFLLYVGIQDSGIRGGLKSLVGGTLPAAKEKTAGGAADQAAGTITGGSKTTASGGATVGSGPHPEIASAGLKYIGVPYRWGGEDTSGMDCSGLVVSSFQDAVGVNPPRTTQAQQRWKQLQPISRAEFGAGDLAFWPQHGAASHVAIGLDNGHVVHAPRPGRNVEAVPVNQAFTGGMEPICMRWVG